MILASEANNSMIFMLFISGFQIHALFWIGCFDTSGKALIDPKDLQTKYDTLKKLCEAHQDEYESGQIRNRFFIQTMGKFNLSLSLVAFKLLIPLFFES